MFLHTFHKKNMSFLAYYPGGNKISWYPGYMVTVFDYCQEGGGVSNQGKGWVVGNIKRRFELQTHHRTPADAGTKDKEGGGRGGVGWKGVFVR